MSAFDQCHEQVVRALEKAGWEVVQSPFRLRLFYRFVYVDLEVARGTNGSREQMLLVEVKCFPDPKNTTRDLYTSIGQYLVYRAMIREKGLPHSVYLAVPETIFSAVFDPAVMQVVKDSQIKIVVVNLEEERIVQWIL